MLMRWWPDMNLLTVESLHNIDQFSKQIGFAAELPGEIDPRSFVRRGGGLIRRRMPLRSAAVVGIAVREVDQFVCSACCSHPSAVR